MRTDVLTSARNRGQPRLPTLSRLPPLTALRAFVVTARHASFARAAEELHVSTAAIGQQVRILETHLGQTLFSRQRGELALTEAGAALYPGLADAFESMVESISGLIRVGARPTLSLVADSSFAARLLAPRLGRLRQGLADVELSISTLEGGRFDPARFDADGAIVAISEPVAGFVCETLFDDAAIAVCTPDFAGRHGLYGAPERLRDASVETLRDGGDDPAFEWTNWLRACAIGVRPARTGPRFSNQPVLIEATLAGHGISLLRQSLVLGELHSGRLVAPFGTPQPTASRYHLVTSPERRRQPEIDFLLTLLRDRDRKIGAAA
ncbi:LysR substrate-binding domain-containing protein [Rhizobiaceae bacterium BDR2-2]|uniref:LysR substrate-binding domain-containing protein n=1 Tax=Ectorhizobium quercum TaxID=2965071 RepID=A0AAE3SWY1_9HYPH|nr:LysR substrate-binding domain-containing protein [Ectorhizobium quercum]MCX8999667.1 LysR substrate-binding domain-containing protein [Ectorhizobium quercum]